MPEPAFQEAWEAQAFAMTAVLRERGHLTAREWTNALSQAITASQQQGGPGDGSSYYHAWLAALETLATAKGLITTDELARRKTEWEQAARATPHGQPIELSKLGA
ncbi:MAG: nitrile hydratase accessory protein [Chloroflexota bacterium]